MPMDEMMGEKESPCVYLTKADLGGKTCKKGDTLTLRVTDIDPETGDVEAELQGGGETDINTGEDIESAFDRAVPEEE